VCCVARMRMTGSPDRKAALITGQIIQEERDRAAN
jgi:hypothetical protein